jgi:hypothetical protein
MALGIKLDSGGFNPIKARFWDPFQAHRGGASGMTGFRPEKHSLVVRLAQLI